MLWFPTFVLFISVLPQVEAYLPSGNWESLWDGKSYKVQTGIVVQVDVSLTKQQRVGAVHEWDKAHSVRRPFSLWRLQAPFGQQAIFLRQGANVTEHVRKLLPSVTRWTCSAVGVGPLK